MMKPSHTLFALASSLLTIGALTAEPASIGVGFACLVLVSFMADSGI